MSINDPVELVFNERKEYWYLRKGRETFYDEDRVLRTWPTACGAVKWAVTELKAESVVLPTEWPGD